MLVHVRTRVEFWPSSGARLTLWQTQEVDATPEDSSSKKTKRKNKKLNGANGVNAHNKGQTLPEPTSYAEVVNQGPADVEKREAQSHSEKDNDHAPGNDSEEAKPTSDSNKTFAEALKQPAESNTVSSSKRGSQASTAVDYPELQSGSDDEDEEERRRRDRQNASEVLYLRWAPLRVPFKRRLQTLAVLFHCLCMGISLSFFFFCCAIVPLWPISTFSVTDTVLLYTQT